MDQYRVTREVPLPYTCDDAAQESDGGDEDDEADQSDPEASEDDELLLPDISVTEAVRDPVYAVSLDPDLQACILCPGKLLKNTPMIDVHKSSKVSRTLSRLTIHELHSLAAHRHIAGDSRSSCSS